MLHGNVAEKMHYQVDADEYQYPLANNKEDISERVIFVK